MKKVVLITARSGFPNGYGAASIIRKYSKGFLKCGYSSKVMLLRPSEYKSGYKILNTEVKGIYEDVEYEYMSKTCFTSDNVMTRHWRYFIALLRTIKYIISSCNEIERVFFYSPDYLLSTILIQITCKVMNIKLVGIKTESSFSDRQRTKRILWKTREKLIYRLFPSMIVITNYLKDQLGQFGYRKKIVVLPIVVDEEMFDGVNRPHKEKSLIYMGTLNYKNELISLINTFSVIHEKYKNAKLHVIGEFVSNELEEMIKNLACELLLEGNIIWHGKIPATKIPDYLSGGEVMVLPRTAGEYSKGGFPIKLGEYLLSGSPTVVTRTGDIEDYLKDGVNVFLVEPNNPDLFAKKVITVLDNPQKSKVVGKRGREVAIEKFGSKGICKVMLEC